MNRISCYHTINENLPKAFTQLTEKCFYNKLQTLVITPNKELITMLDKVLWTYSRKHFIPHGTSADPFAEKQPIYITDEIANPNKAEIIIFVNIDETMLLDFLSNIDNEITTAHHFSRIMFLFDDLIELQSVQIKNILEKSSLLNYAEEYFSQGINNDWSKVTF